MALQPEAIVALLRSEIGDDRVLGGDEIKDDYGHDEALGATPQVPAAVALPETTEHVAAVLRVANDNGVPVTARGSGTGLSGAVIPAAGAVVVSFERMN